MPRVPDYQESACGENGSRHRRNFHADYNRGKTMPRISAKQQRALDKAAPETAFETPGEPHCPLCGRVMVPGPSADEHHLVPKSKRGRDKFLVHRVCHTKIHATLTEKELAERYNTWEALRAQPEIAVFIAWVQKKPPEYMDRNITSRSKR
jgi:hypothetical protein